MPRHVGQLALLIERSLGIRVDPRVSAIGATVGVASAVLLRENPNRVAWSLTNLDAANVIYVAPMGAASATRGIRIGPAGGGLDLVWRDDLEAVGYEWQAIATGAGTPYFLLELIARAEPGGFARPGEIP